MVYVTQHEQGKVFTPERRDEITQETGQDGTEKRNESSRVSGIIILYIRIWSERTKTCMQ